jgi:hypothetical protein
METCAGVDYNVMLAGEINDKVGVVQGSKWETGYSLPVQCFLEFLKTFLAMDEHQYCRFGQLWSGELKM